MEGKLPADRFRPPNPSTVMHKPNIFSPLQESSLESTYSSSQLIKEAIHIAMVERDQNRGKGTGEKDSQSHDIHNSQKSHDFIILVERNPQARRRGILVIRDKSDIGDCTTGRGGHHIEASSTFNGGIAGSGDSAEILVKNFENFQYEEERRVYSQTQIQHREGKQHVQELGKSSTSHMDEKLIKKQGKDTNIIHIDKSCSTVIPAIQAHLNSGTEQCRNENDQMKTWVSKAQGKGNTVYQDNYPRISSNFDKQVPKSNTNNVRSDRPQVNPHNPSKTDPLAAPTPYIVVQTYADRLRYNQAKCDVPITLRAPEITTK
ncbi:hypothetical protein H5410_027607 [Solanum commersonii]|uniref:Uncharacterized protein n=1 Tax=Solanum commersonii TaxID=4109 RepID=A0A9J5YZN0_SOLCO|nr:hypothetical protein H5410_027607 [Solanum commersonii]